MTAYDKIERDFIRRTIDILDQYEEFKEGLPADSQYEVTLLLNSLLGLLVYPQQLAAKSTADRYRQWLTKEMVSTVGLEWGIAPEFVKSAGYKWTDENNNKKRYRQAISVTELSLRNLLRQMRNSVAHAQFRVDDVTKKIDRVEFESNQDGIRFHVVIPILELDRFVRRISESAIKLVDGQSE